MYQINENRGGWCAAQASAEGWSVTTDIEWDGNRIVRKETRIVSTRGEDEETAFDYVATNARAGSAYHQIALGMVGVEKMGWNEQDERISRTFTDINGVTRDLHI